MALRADVGDRDREQLACLAQAQEPGRTPRTGHEFPKVVYSIEVHAAAGMPPAQIALVQRHHLGGLAHRLDRDLEVPVALATAPHAAVRPELGDGYARRHAGPAAAAVGAVHMATGAAESPRQREVVQARQLRRQRVDHEVLRVAALEVPARVLERPEQADRFGAHGPMVTTAQAGDHLS
jgi:hypothetical protein